MFKAEKFHRIHRSISKHKTFKVKQFCFDNNSFKSGGLKSTVFSNHAGRIHVIYIPWRRSPPSQNYGIHGSNPPDKINIKHNVKMAYGPLFYLLCIQI